MEKIYNKFIRNDIATFSKDVDTLRYLVRYQNVPRVNEESVLEHIGATSLLCLKLREYYTFDLEKALKTSLVHDISESRLSDIPHNIKIANPDLLNAFEKAEDKVNREILSDEAAEYIHNFNNGSTPEGLAVQLADILSVVLYARAELAVHNDVFNYIAIKAIERCKQVVQQLEPYINPTYTSSQIMNKINQIINIY